MLRTGYLETLPGGFSRGGKAQRAGLFSAGNSLQGRVFVTSSPRGRMAGKPRLDLTQHQHSTAWEFATSQSPGSPRWRHWREWGGRDPVTSGLQSRLGRTVESREGLDRSGEMH
jgi:hypothetical protein